jgi:tetratricopeptide (TPR) repeat protein
LSALEFENASSALAEAEALDPDDRQMLSGKSIQLMFAGRYDEAQTYCRRSLRMNRDDAAAYKLLTQLANGRLPDDDFAALQRLADREDISVQDRISAVFALADCLDARGEMDQAFTAYERANRLASEFAVMEGNIYDRVARTKQTDELMAILDSMPMRMAVASGPTPVFIVGMPRSSTTLIESVIGAHSRVFACGERVEMRWIMEEFLTHARNAGTADIPEAAWKHWRDFYWREIPDLKGATVVTDKNPWNFDAVGLILRLFPDARIIHVRRKPLETGLSIYRNAFSKFQPFTNRLEDIGHYYGQYARLMAHWERIAGDRITTIQYEDFIRRFEVAGPALLAACGLEWEEPCRTYWNSSRVISTMSTMQARQPPGERAGRAELYAAHLLPLVNSLKASGVDLKSGSILDATSTRLV